MDNEVQDNIWESADEDATSVNDGNPDESEGNNDAQPSGDELTPAEQARFQKMWAEHEKKLAEAIAKGDTKNGVYTGMQRLVAERERANAALRQDIAALQEQISGAGDAFDWIAETVLEALPEADRDRAKLALFERRDKAAAERAKQANQQRQAQQTSQQAPNEPDGDEVMKAIHARIEAFVNDRKAKTKAMGLDPDDKAIDYGNDEDSFFDRLAKWEASVEKAKASKDDARVAGVRQNIEVSPTRSGGGGTPVPYGDDGIDGLRRASLGRLSEMRRKAGIV